MKKFFLFCVLILAAIPAFPQENITITTYYPAPFGVYREMRMFKNAEHQQIDLNNDGGGNPNVEMRYMSNVIAAGAGTPYIDFSNDPNIDFDFRLILMGNSDFRLRSGSASGVVTISRNNGAGGEVFAPLRAGEIWLCGGAVGVNP